jgi:hypothetical protein
MTVASLGVLKDLGKSCKCREIAGLHGQLRFCRALNADLQSDARLGWFNGAGTWTAATCT